MATEAIKLPASSYSTFEESINSISHGIATLLSVVALTMMIMIAQNALQLASAIIYGSSMVLLFLASTLYHTFTKASLKKVFKLLDHCAIYVLIAGSYTPFMLLSLKSSTGYIILSVVWTLAVIGIYFKIVFKQRFPKVSLFTYLGMGWLIVIAAPEMLSSIPFGGLVLLAAGGVAYSLGAVFYAIKSIPLNHAIWHIFVLAGSVCHFFSVYLYVM